MNLQQCRLGYVHFPAHPELLAACGDDGTTVVLRSVRDISAASGGERNQRACRAQGASPALLSFDAKTQTIGHRGVDRPRSERQ